MAIPRTGVFVLLNRNGQNGLETIQLGPFVKVMFCPDFIRVHLGGHHPPDWDRDFAQFRGDGWYLVPRYTKDKTYTGGWTTLDILSAEEAVI